MAVYATYFDSRFLVRGAACIRSLLAHSREPVDVLALALDETCARQLPALLGPVPPGSSVAVEPLAAFEARHAVLLRAKADRPSSEYIFTLTPFLCRDALNRAPAGDVAVYLDADTFFFADPALATGWMGQAEIGLTEHRFPCATRHLARIYGRFNVGWLAFRHTPAALRCLERWAGQCIASCSMDPATGAFGDQKYLDAWPEQFPSVHVVACPGLNAAPWNASAHSFAASPRGVTVDGQPLVLFHFHRLVRHGPGVYETDYRDYGALSAALRDHVYLPYIAALEDLWQRHRAILPEAAPPPALGGVARRAVRRVLAAGRLFSRRRVVFSGGRALSPLQGLVHV
jgi:hypothetical protein